MAARFDSGSLETYGAVQSSGAGVTVPDATLLFTGDYSRTGSDLTITGSDGAKFVVAGYFETDTPPSLISPQGAMLTGDVVTSLAGPQFPGMYAQAGGGAAAGAKEIGKVQTLEGSGSVIRANGITETLKAGDPVFEGDVVMTGPASKMGIGFLDGTVFSMSASARMVLNSLVYDANGSDNSMLFNLVEGSFVFAAGKIAPTGDMKIHTPVATMGIRGTAPTVDINSESGTVNFSIIPDPGDGHVGNYTLYSLESGQPIGTISSVGTKWVLTSADGTITELEKTEDDLLKDAEAVNQINSVYNSYQNNSQNPQAGPENNGPPNSSGLNTNTNNNENIDGGGQNNLGGGNTPPPPPQGGTGSPSGNNPPPGGQTNNNPPQENNNPPENDNPPDNNTPPENGGGGGETGPNVITGTENSDVLNGTPGVDEINALGGDDFIFASQGNDDIDGGEGTDTVNYSAATQAVIFNLVDGTVQGEFGLDTVASIERFVGGSGDDTLIVNADTGWFFDGGDGVDTIQVIGALNIDTFSMNSDAENIEIIDLNQESANTLTISVDDFLNRAQELLDGEDEEPNNSLQIRGGTTDVVNLTNLMRPDEELAIEGLGIEALNVDFQNIGFVENGGPNVFEGYWTLAGTEQIDGLTFDIYHFISAYDEGQGPLAVAKIQQGIQVNFLIESFENGFEPNGWERTINDDGSGPTIVDANSTEGTSSVFLSTTTGTELDDPFGVGESEEDDGEDGNVERGNAEDIADFLNVELEDLDDLADPEGEKEVIEGSAIQTTFFAMPGQVLSFDWFFTTNEGIEGEYGIVNDIAFVVIDGELFKLFDAESTGNVKRETAFEGWNNFSIVLGEGDGDYDYEHTIGFGVLDSEDPEVETNLNIDNIRLGPAPDGLSMQVDGDVFLHGEFLEVGVSESGSLGTDNSAPDGFHPTSEEDQISFIYDPDGFDVDEPYVGDATLPGTPEDSFSIGFKTDGEPLIYTNAERVGDREIETTTINTSSGSRLSATTTGIVGGMLAFTQEVFFSEFDTYFTTTITLTNTSSSTINDVRFMRSFDPDHEVDVGGDFETYNDVIRNPDTGGMAIVQAQGTDQDIALSLVSIDGDARASSFGFTNRDPYEPSAYDNPVDPDGALDDRAISLTFDFGDIAPGETVTKTFYTTLHENVPDNTEIFGTDGNDLLIGSNGDESIEGNDGDDIIIGNGGDDTLAGGLGADRFVIASLTDGIDTITDFEIGLDALDLSGLLATEINGQLPSGNDLGQIIKHYVQALEDGNGNISIGVDLNGAAGGKNFTEIAVLQNIEPHAIGTGVEISVLIGDQETTVESTATV